MGEQLNNEDRAKRQLPGWMKWVLDSNDNEAKRAIDEGDYRKAEQSYKNSLACIEKVLGREHPDTAMSYYNLAKLYFDEGNYKTAEQFYLHALDILKEVDDEGSQTFDTVSKGYTALLEKTNRLDQVRESKIRADDIGGLSEGPQTEFHSDVEAGVGLAIETRSYHFSKNETLPKC